MILFIFFSFRCSTWLRIIKREDILSSCSKDYIYNNGKLCNLHFKDEAFTSTLRLKLSKFAVPFLENDGSTDSMMNCSSTNLSKISEFQAAGGSILTSTPKTNETIPQSMTYLYEPVPSTSKDISVIPKANEEESENLSPQCNEKLICTNSAPRVPKLTPKTRRIMTLESSLTKCKRKIFKLETSLHKTSLAESLRSKLTNVQYLFVMAQIRLHNKSKQGRRWSAEEKAMAYNIYARSTNTYNYLCDRFAFPSISTLRRSVGPIAINTGICPIILHCLKRKVNKMKHQEKFCILTFDEMSIKESLSYNAALDSVDGFESIERKDGNPQLATQALVFMLRGLTTNWKQVQHSCLKCFVNKIFLILLLKLFII